jgi:hypothetical protein
MNAKPLNAARVAIEADQRKRTKSSFPNSIQENIE